MSISSKPDTVAHSLLFYPHLTPIKKLLRRSVRNYNYIGGHLTWMDTYDEFAMLNVEQPLFLTRRIIVSFNSSNIHFILQAMKRR